ncbi:MAG TPA: ABC transporter permease [Planctomycetaceae bacterium]
MPAAPLQVALRPAEDADGLRLKVITPPIGWQVIDLAELWRYRELLYFFAWRDVKVRYKQTLLGAAWAVIQPLLMMVVFTAFLGRLAGQPAGDAPYPLYVFAGLVPWMFFATAVGSASNSVVSSESIITKIYFPRMLVPFAAVGAAVVDCVCALGVLLAMLAYYRVWPGWSILLVPLIIGLIGIAALGVGTLLAALNVAYRDVKYAIPFLLQLWMFATPAIYMGPGVEPASDMAAPNAAHATTSQGPAPLADPGAKTASLKSQLLPDLKDILKLNPMNRFVRFLRAAALGRPLPWIDLVWGAAIAVAVLGFGVVYFRRIENTFADII